MNNDILEQARRYTDDAYELCYEELQALREEVEFLRERIERLEGERKIRPLGVGFKMRPGELLDAIAEDQSSLRF